MRVEVTQDPVLGGSLRVAHPPAEAWDEVTACPVCDRAEHLRLVARIEGTSAGTAISACLDCQHLFLSRRPSASWLKEYYARDWDRSGQERLEKRVAEILPTSKVADFCAAQLEPGSTVLDVGAGFGSNLLGFREAGHHPYGVEMSEHRARMITEKLGIPCPAGEIESAQMPAAPDLVYSHHVLEHVSDPSALIGTAARLVRDGGSVYTAVPNLWHEFAPQTLHFAPHVTTFTRRSLGRLLERHGLRTVKERVDRELQVLAVRDAEPALPEPATGPDADAERERFWAQVEAWVLGGFGARRGRRALMWRKSRDSSAVYERKQSRPISPRLLAATTLRGPLFRLPRNLGQRLAPFASSADLRILPVDVKDGGSLPLTLSYPGSAGPIWVK